MNNKYIVSTAIKCSDDKIHRLSYDLTEQTEGSVYEFGRVFGEIEKRFPDAQFWIDQYPDKSTDNFIRIYGNEVKDSLKVEGAIHQISDITSPSVLGIDY
jgi:hypothetical protein